MSSAPHIHQRGSALIVSLILLVALSLLGIASMNTASLDLIMAGNEQYRSQAFDNAAIGIERALATQKGDTINFNPDAPYDSGVINLGGDAAYRIQINAKFGGKSKPPTSDTTMNTGTSNGYRVFVYDVTVDGVSSRGSNVRQVQGVFQTTFASQSQTPLDAPPPGLGGPPLPTSLNAFSVTATL